MPVAVALAAASTALAGSLSVEPLFIEVAPGQSGAVRVRNGSESAQTVELSVAERTVDEFGKQSRVPADDAFILFPPQGVIPANGIQVFRLQPIAVDPAKSQSFFLTVRQLPVALAPLEGDGAQLQVIFAFDIAVHTVPRGAKSEVEIVTSSLSTMTVEVPPNPGQAGQPVAADPRNPTRPALVKTETVPAVTVTVVNNGSKYTYLHDFSYNPSGLDSAGNRVAIPNWDRDTIIDSAKVSLLQPGARRTFSLPLRGLPLLRTIQLRLSPRSAG